MAEAPVTTDDSRIETETYDGIESKRIVKKKLFTKSDRSARAIYLDTKALLPRDDSYNPRPRNKVEFEQDSQIDYYGDLEDLSMHFENIHINDAYIVNCGIEKLICTIAVTKILDVPSRLIHLGVLIITYKKNALPRAKELAELSLELQMKIEKERDDEWPFIFGDKTIKLNVHSTKKEIYHVVRLFNSFYEHLKYIMSVEPRKVETGDTLMSINTKVTKRRAALNNQIKVSKSKRLCMKCKNNRAELIAIPCRHMFCKICLPDLSSVCQLCQVKLETMHNIYFA